MNKLKRFAYWFEIAALGIVLGLILQGARAWTEPSQDPPGGNVGAPINTGDLTQVKSGTIGTNLIGNTIGLIVGDGGPLTGLENVGDNVGQVGIGKIPALDSKLDVEGKVHATGDVCTDLNGGKCLKDLSSSGSGGGVKGTPVQNGWYGFNGGGTYFPFGFPGEGSCPPGYNAVDLTLNYRGGTFSCLLNSGGGTPIKKGLYGHSEASQGQVNHTSPPFNNDGSCPSGYERVRLADTGTINGGFFVGFFFCYATDGDSAPAPTGLYGICYEKVVADTGHWWEHNYIKACQSNDWVGDPNRVDTKTRAPAFCEGSGNDSKCACSDGYLKIRLSGNESPGGDNQVFYSCYKL